MPNSENMSQDPAPRVTRSQKRLNSTTPPQVVPLKAFNKIVDKDNARSPAPATRSRRSSTTEALNSTPVLSSPARRITRRTSLSEALTPQPSPMRRSRRLSTNLEEPSTPSKTVRTLRTRGALIIEQVPEEENVDINENLGQKPTPVENFEKQKDEADFKDIKDDDIQEKNLEKTTDEKVTPPAVNNDVSKAEDENIIELDSTNQNVETGNQPSITVDESILEKPDDSVEPINEDPVENITIEKPDQREDEKSNTEDRNNEIAMEYRKAETTPRKETSEKDSIIEDRNEVVAKEYENQKNETTPSKETSTTPEDLNTPRKENDVVIDERNEKIAKESENRKNETTPSNETSTARDDLNSPRQESSETENDEIIEDRNEEIAKESENRKGETTPSKEPFTSTNSVQNTTRESTLSPAPEILTKSAEKRKIIEFSKSWSQPVIRKVTEESCFIDGFTAKQPTPDKEVTPNKKTTLTGRKSESITKRIIAVSSSDDESENSEAENARNEFLDSEAMEAIDGEDSMNSSEREYLEQNEIPIKSESIGSDDTDELTNSDFSEEMSSFIVSDEELEKLSDTDSLYGTEKKPYRRIMTRPIDSSSDDASDGDDAKNEETKKTDSKRKSMSVNSSSVQYISSDKIEEDISSDEKDLSEEKLDASASIDTDKKVVVSPKHAENLNKSKLDSSDNENNKKMSSSPRKSVNTSVADDSKLRRSGRIQATLNESSKAITHKILIRNSNINDESDDDDDGNTSYEEITKFANTSNPTTTDLNKSKNNKSLLKVSEDAADKSLSKELNNSQRDRSSTAVSVNEGIANIIRRSLRGLKDSEKLEPSPSRQVDIEKQEMNTSQKSKAEKLDSSEKPSATQKELTDSDLEFTDSDLKFTDESESEHDKSNEQEKNTSGKFDDEVNSSKERKARTPRLNKSESNTPLQKLSNDEFADRNTTDKSFTKDLDSSASRKLSSIDVKSNISISKKEKSKIQDLNKSKLCGQDSDEADFEAEFSDSEDIPNSGIDQSASIQSDEHSSDAGEEENSLEEEPEENLSNVEDETEEESSDREPEETAINTSKRRSILLVEKPESAEKTSNCKSSLISRRSLNLSKKSNEIDSESTESKKRQSLNTSKRNKSLVEESNTSKKRKSLMAGNTPAKRSTAHLSMVSNKEESSDNGSSDEENAAIEAAKSTNRRSSLKPRQSLNISKQSNKFDTDVQESHNKSNSNKSLAKICLNTSKKNKSLLTGNVSTRRSEDSTLHLSKLYRSDDSSDNDSSDETAEQDNANKTNATFNNDSSCEDDDNAVQDTNFSMRSENKSNRTQLSLKTIEASSSDEEQVAHKNQLFNTSLARSMENKTNHSTPIPNKATKRLSASSALKNSNKKRKSSLSKSLITENAKGSIEATTAPTSNENEKLDIVKIQERLEAYLAAANELKRQQKLIGKSSQPKKVKKTKPAKVEEIINKPIKKKSIKPEKKSDEIKKSLPRVKQLLEKEMETLEKEIAKTQRNKRSKIIEDNEDKKCNKLARKRTKSRSNAADQIIAENPIHFTDENISAFAAHSQNKSKKNKKNKSNLSTTKAKPVALAASTSNQIPETTTKRSRHISNISVDEFQDIEIIEQTKSKNKKNLAASDLQQDCKKKKLNILDDIPFGPFAVQPVTPDSKKTINGFLESNSTPKPIGFKVRSILSAGQKETPEVVVEKRKRRNLTKELKITDYQPKRVWTSVGFFDITDAENTQIPKKQQKQYRPNSHGASTDFVVKPLEIKKQKNIAFNSISASALDFKKKALFNDKIQRETAVDLLQRKNKKIAFKKH